MESFSLGLTSQLVQCGPQPSTDNQQDDELDVQKFIIHSSYVRNYENFNRYFETLKRYFKNKYFETFNV